MGASRLVTYSSHPYIPFFLWAGVPLGSPCRDLAAVHRACSLKFKASQKKDDPGVSCLSRASGPQWDHDGGRAWDGRAWDVWAWGGQASP